MDTIVSQIGTLTDEAELILKDADQWWVERGNKLRAAQCQYCEGSGVMHVSMAPDDYEEQVCICQEHD